jgi:hypothetical protein
VISAGRITVVLRRAHYAREKKSEVFMNLKHNQLGLDVP